MIIREKIIKYLENNNRQSIKQISEGIKAKENIIRSKIYEKPYGLMAKGKVVKVDHIGRRNYFSLKENATPTSDNNETVSCLLQHIILFTEIRKHMKKFDSMDKGKLITLAKRILDFDLLEKKEKEMRI